MNLADLLARLLNNVPQSADARLLAYVRQLATVGEPDLAVVTLIENVPEVLNPRDAAEVVVLTKGTYVEREARNAVRKWQAAQAA